MAWKSEFLEKSAHELLVRQVIGYQPNGKRRRGKPEHSCGRTMTKEHKEIGLSWWEIKQSLKQMHCFLSK